MGCDVLPLNFSLHTNCFKIGPLCFLHPYGYLYILGCGTRETLPPFGHLTYALGPYRTVYHLRNKTQTVTAGKINY